jgi:vancomycin resistance protein YoaR
MSKKKETILLKNKIVQPIIQKKQEIQELIAPKKSRKKWFVLVGVVVVIPSIIAGILFSYQELYKGKIYGGISLAGTSLGGMDKTDVVAYVGLLKQAVQKKGFTLDVIKEDGSTETVPLSVPFSFSTSSFVSKAYSLGREGNAFQQLVAPWLLLFSPRTLEIPFVFDEELLRSALKNSLHSFEDEPHNAAISVTAISPLQYSIIPEKSGLLFDYDSLVKKLQIKLANLNTTPLEVWPSEFSPTITATDANGAISFLPSFLNTPEPFLIYEEKEAGFKKQWKVNKQVFSTWIELNKEESGKFIFGFKKERIENFLLTEIAPYIERSAENAVFQMENDKVVEFKASKVGQKIDVEKTVEDLNSLLRDQQNQLATTNTISVAIKTIEPEIKTADVNSLGITDVVGVGISTFKDSHNNRIKNIANAVKRLNGTLIKPGEVFSANKSAGPYILANGFLPEAVIKGDEIKNEVGGGMCQIGTTLFRMAMNSGMDIVERRNHSLVVSYYADPVNGNPGTDATLYEPILDLKFLNDTGNYLLLQTDIDYKRQQLTFTLWGKPDGRSGSYTHPIVERWIGVGAPKEIEVDTLPPGKKKCQSAFPGAVASFTYTRTTPDGQEIVRVFDSYYRSLPKICMVGKTVCPEGQVCGADGQAIVPPVDSVDPVVDSGFSSDSSAVVQ